MRIHRTFALLGLVVAPSLAASPALDAQSPAAGDMRISVPAFVFDTAPVLVFRSERDSLDWSRARLEAERASGFKVVVSLLHRRVWVIFRADTLLSAPAAVASGLTLDYADRSWTFSTPRGRREVLRKLTDPVWVPPEWHYAEVALEHGLELARAPAAGDLLLANGNRLTVRARLVGLLSGDGEFVALPIDEHIVFDGKLFVPPLGTLNRRISGELGDYALDLGDGYLIHGTPHKRSIGRAVTHGCIRLADDDIAWMYELVPVGTPVYIY